MRVLLAAALLLAGPAAAQDDTLADIRRQLSAVNAEIGSLRGLLADTGSGGGALGGASPLERMAAIEAELQRLTQTTERLQFRVESVARDGGNRVEDLRFQLCELTPDCDLGALPDPGPLGGEAEGTAPPGAPAPLPSDPGPQLAVGEQADFDAAAAALAEGRNAEAAEGFTRFLNNYPTGPLTTRAQLSLGQALAADGQSAEAARAYLDAFSGAPEGPQAPDALLGLGQSLGALGQTDEACLTLDEVAIRFPNAPAAAQAVSARGGLACN